MSKLFNLNYEIAFGVKTKMYICANTEWHGLGEDDDDEETEDEVESSEAREK